MHGYLDTLIEHDDKVDKVLLENILDQYEPSNLQSQVSLNDSNIENSSLKHQNMTRTMSKSTFVDKINM